MKIQRMLASFIVTARQKMLATGTRHILLVIRSQFQKVGGLLAPAMRDIATHLTSASVSLCLLASVKSKNASSQQSTSWKHLRLRIRRKAQRGSCQCVAHRNFIVAAAEPSDKARPTRQQTHQPKKPDEEAWTLHTRAAAAVHLPFFEKKANYSIAALRIYRVGASSQPNPMLKHDTQHTIFPMGKGGWQRWFEPKDWHDNT